MSWWIVEVMDDALMGLYGGEIGESTVAGPFLTREDAWEAKQKYKAWGSIYYKLVEAEAKPPTWSRRYEFERGEFSEY